MMEKQSTSNIENQTGNVKDRDNKHIQYIEKKEKEPDCENECAICLDNWTPIGAHMATRLKCGHIFGYSCIREWVQKARSCPLCKSYNTKSHLRRLYQSHRLGTNHDSPSTSVVDEARNNRRWKAKCSGRLARDKQQTQARLAADERHRGNAEATESQHS